MTARTGWAARRRASARRFLGGGSFSNARTRAHTCAFAIGRRAAERAMRRPRACFSASHGTARRHATANSLGAQQPRWIIQDGGGWALQLLTGHYSDQSGGANLRFYRPREGCGMNFLYTWIRGCKSACLQTAKHASNNATLPLRAHRSATRCTAKRKLFYSRYRSMYYSTHTNNS